eukprot:scaffold17893_cov81-Isochrysis_galbana.AAC.2
MAWQGTGVGGWGGKGVRIKIGRPFALRREGGGLARKREGGGWEVSDFEQAGYVRYTEGEGGGSKSEGAGYLCPTIGVGVRGGRLKTGTCRLFAVHEEVHAVAMCGAAILVRLVVVVGSERRERDGQRWTAHTLLVRPASGVFY